MSGLVLKLAPKERILLNGAVIENGDRRGRMTIITPDASILRLRDAIHPQDANTPASRLAYIAQLALTGDVAASSCVSQIRSGARQLDEALVNPKATELLSQAMHSAEKGQFYACLKLLRRVMDIESATMRTAK